MKSRNEARKICRDKKREMIDNEIKELETENRKNENRKFYKKLKTLTKTYKPRNRNIKARDGSVLTDEKEILNRWNKHFKGEQSVQPFEYYENESYDEKTEEPTLEEIQEIIRNLKRMKTPGTENINAQLLQAAGPQMTQRIRDLILNIWRSERMPNEWNKSIICPIYQKGEKSGCSNYTGISLLKNAYKVLTTVINNRLATYAEDLLSQEQNGFRETDQLRTTYLDIREML